MNASDSPARRVQRRQLVRRPPGGRRTGHGPRVPLRGPRADLRRRARARRSHRQRAPRTWRGDGAARRHDLPRHPRVPGDVLGRDQDRRGAGAGEHAAPRGGLPLRPGRQPRPGGRRLGAAPRRGGAGPRGRAVPPPRAGRGRRARAASVLRGPRRRGRRARSRPRRPPATTSRSGCTPRARPAAPRAPSTSTTTW